MKHQLITGMIVTMLTGTLATMAQTGVTSVAGSTSVAIIAELTATQRSGKKESLEVELVGRQGNKLAYREKGGPREASLSIDLASIVSLDFDIQLEADPFSRAIANRDWTVVATTLWPVLTPLMPYLDITDNNAAALAYTMGNAMIKVADGYRRANADDKARRLYVEAYKVLEVISKAQWFEDAESARLKGVLCLVAITNYPQAEAQLKTAQVPEIGDASWGLYWYAQAVLKYARGNVREAMNAVTRSLAFENKDIDIFPDALLLSARLYEDLLEPYRARDVYYEVAKVFPDTEWATIAREHLKYIMDKGLTKEPEKSSVEVVFFGLNENVNAKVTALLKGDDRAPILEETSTTLEVDEADMQSGKKGETAPAADASAPPPDPGAPPPPPKTSAMDAAKQAGKASTGARAAKTEALK